MAKNSIVILRVPNYELECTLFIFLQESRSTLSVTSNNTMQDHYTGGGGGSELQGLFFSFS